VPVRAHPEESIPDILGALQKDLRNLQTLNLYGCTVLSSIDALKDLGNLQELDLGGCTALNSIDTLKELSNLQTLNLSDCTGLSSIDALKDLRNLKTLKLSKTNRFSTDAIKELREQLPQMRINCPKLQVLDQ
jgi:Leucine-rich repeat (LRR) protein